MRDIKFRAWNTVINAYYYNVQTVYDEDLADSFQNILDNDELIVEEFTGIKDKNGVDIYEGDILKSVNGVQDVVIYIDGRFEPICWYKPESFEVIGNIHENADLLEDQL